MTLSPPALTNCWPKLGSVSEFNTRGLRIETAIAMCSDFSYFRTAMAMYIISHLPNTAFRREMSLS